MAEHIISHRIPLPRNWSLGVKSAMVQSISLAHHAMAYTRSCVVKSPMARLRLKEKNERLCE